jgi:diguanylate cyclase
VKSTREMRDQQGAGKPAVAVEDEISNLQHSLEAIRQSLTDPLTGWATAIFRPLDRHGGADGAGKRRAVVALMFDIDHFKSFNDSYGHLTGDQVLRLVAMSLKQTIKGQDITARYGGEEFAVVLPNTGLRQALTVADHIRRAVMAKELKKKSTGEILGRVTISVGVSMLKPDDDTDSLIERADACLYAAKRNGRNRVICEVDPEYAAEAHSQVSFEAPATLATSCLRWSRARLGAAGCGHNRLAFAAFVVPSVSPPCAPFGRLRNAALRGRQRRPRPSRSSSGSSNRRAGNCQYEFTVTVLARV